MAKIDLARRAEIGREKRARTRAQIVEAGTMLLAERAPEALTVDAIVEAAGVAKGTFYYHFQSIEELATAVGEKLLESFDDLLAPTRLACQILLRACPSPLPNSSKKAIADPLWARLVIRSAQAPTEFALSVRANLKADLAEARAQGRLTIQDIELAADIGLGTLLGVMRGTLQRRAAPDLVRHALDAALRGLGALQ